MTAAESWTYEHPALPFALDLPLETQLVSDLPPLFALKPMAGDYVPSVVVTCEPLDAQRSLDDWVDEVLARQEELLPVARLVDRERDPGEPPQGQRTLCSIVHGGIGLTLAQWWQRGLDRGWTLTASCPTLAYGALAETFETVGESFATR